ncbi:hypothetical protein [Jeotgalibacillus marinus]|uniref:Stage III sporulation protein AB n=1 Tax=Jeotgalibacillus marinus TaxID=86667 RepID=A0ABV3PZ75_9BACL
MTIQLLGAIFIVVGSGLEGFRRAYMLQKHQRVLINLANAFSWMQNEIVKRQTPILDIVKDQQLRKGDVELLYEKFNHHLVVSQFLLRDAWIEAVKEYGEYSLLNQEDLEWIERIGEAIQQFDRQSIDKELSFVIDVLRNRHHEARNRAIQFGKLYKTLGVMGGVLLVLLLS